MSHASVYFLQVGPDTGPVKIGRTRDVRARIAAMQTGCPDELRLLVEMPCVDMEAASRSEKAFHSMLAEERIRPSGEWFRWSKHVSDLVEKLRWFNALPRGAFALRTKIHCLTTGIVIDPSPATAEDRLAKAQAVAVRHGGEIRVVDAGDRYDLQIDLPNRCADEAMAEIRRVLGNYVLEPTW